MYSLVSTSKPYLAFIVCDSQTVCSEVHDCTKLTFKHLERVNLNNTSTSKIKKKQVAT